MYNTVFQLSEIAQGVWCCPLKVKFLINSVTRTSLAYGLLAIFYPKEELSGRRLGELDQCIVKAIAGTIPLFFWNFDTFNIHLVYLV